MNSIWIARDKDGSLRAYEQRPQRCAKDGIWNNKREEGQFEWCLIKRDWFSGLDWDDEPIELAIK